MRKNWKIFEKLLAIVEILVGLSLIILLIYSWSSSFQYMVDSGQIAWSEISILKLIRNAHFIFLSGAMGLVSGILLLKGKKLGWILSVSSWIVYCFGTLMILWKLEKVDDPINIQNYIIVGLLILFFLIMAMVLSLKPFRLKYKPDSKSWITIAVIILVFLLDKLLIK